MKPGRTAPALLVGLFIVGLGTKALAFVINEVGSLTLYGFTDSEVGFRNLDATANIVGLLGALYLAVRCYRWITRQPAASDSALAK